MGKYVVRTASFKQLNTTEYNVIQQNPEETKHSQQGTSVVAANERTYHQRSNKRVSPGYWLRGIEISNKTRTINKKRTP